MKLRTLLLFPVFFLLSCQQLPEKDGRIVAKDIFESELKPLIDK